MKCWGQALYIAVCIEYDFPLSYRLYKDACILKTQPVEQQISKRIPAYRKITSCLPRIIAWCVAKVDSARITKCGVMSIPKSSTTNVDQIENLKSVNIAIEDAKQLQQDSRNGSEAGDLHLLASGGYNDVWLVSRPYQDTERYVLRIPKKEALLPDQIRNEVAFLTFVKKRLQYVPVPRVFSHSLDEIASSTPFITEEFMDGERLSSAWTTYDESTKLAVAHQIAEIIVEFAETTSHGIGGLMLDHELGPTVEGMKLFKGRVGVW